MRCSTLSGMAAAAMAVAGPAWAQSTLTAAPGSGHPSIATTVSGSGFGNSEAVDLYLDTTDEELLVTSPTGTLKGSLTIPSSAQPGTHYITAIGRRSGDAAQYAFYVTTPWVEHGYGAAGLKWNPYENTINTGNVGTLGTQWDVTSNSLGNTPAVTSGRVIVNTTAGVQAYAATTGAVVWSSETSQAFYASPAVVGNVVYIGGSSPNFYALSATTGAQLWDTPIGGATISSAVVANGVVYFGCNDNKVYALQASTGTILWTYATGGVVEPSPAVVGGVVYIGSADDKLYALNAATGSLIWSYATGGAVESSPAVSNGVVYFGSDDAKVYAIRAKGPDTGSLLWSYTTGGAVFEDPAVANGTVLVGSLDKNMYALNARTGALQWDFATQGIVGTAAVANGVVYYSARDGSFYAANAVNGAVLASGQFGNTYLGGPVVSDGVVYVSQNFGDTFALTLDGGSGSARVPTPPPVPAALHPDLKLKVTR